MNNSNSLFNISQLAIVEKWLLTIFIFQYLVLFFIPYSPLMAFVPAIFFALMVYFVLNISFFDKKFIAILLLALLAYFLWDWSSAYSIFYMLIGYHICYLIASQDYMELNIDIVYKIYLYVFIPCFLLNSFFGHFEGTGNTLCYIPSPATGFRINVIAWGNTIHGTALLGLCIGLVSAYQIFFCDRKEKKHYLFLLLALYFVIFAGSRSTYISAIYLLLTILIYKYYPKEYLLYAVLFAFIVSTFMSESLAKNLNSSSNNDVYNSLLKTDNINKKYGVTSGRSWLWTYHINKFIKSNGYGVGKNGFQLTLRKKTDTGEIAHAASESPSTELLARYGFLGICLNLFFIYMFVCAVQEGNKLGTLIMGANITQFVGGGGHYMYLPSVFFLLMITLFFFSFRKSPALLKV